MLLTIMRGISGSGKSSYIEQYFPHATVCSADDFFIVDGKFEYVASMIEKAHDSCFRKFMEAIATSVEHIVIDNTNIHLWNFYGYIQFARIYGYDIEIITLVCDPRVALTRNIHGNTEQTLLRQAESLQKIRLPWFFPHHNIIET